MSGVELGFSESDLAATAAAYDPTKHEAPIVIGHPKHDAPAFGWVRSLAFADGLEAEPQQVDPEFAEMVERGAFKKVSASFYSPDSPQNPVPGVFYLRHVGFLGAQPPAVKGLRAPEFADNEVGVVEFADWGDMQNASILRSLREWIISKFSLEDADQAIPGYAVSAVEQDALTDDSDSTAGGTPAQFSEKGNDQVSPAEKAALEAENARLKADAAERDARDKAAAATTRHNAHIAFAEGLAKEGKLIPAQKDVAVATLDFMASQESVVEFGEGDARKPLLDAFKEMLQALPTQVDFAERGGNQDAAAAATASFDAPRGYTVDLARLDLHNKALSYAEQNKCDYVTAVKAVEKI